MVLTSVNDLISFQLVLVLFVFILLSFQVEAIYHSSMYH